MIISGNDFVSLHKCLTWDGGNSGFGGGGWPTPVNQRMVLAESQKEHIRGDIRIPELEKPYSYANQAQGVVRTVINKDDPTRPKWGYIVHEDIIKDEGKSSEQNKWWYENFWKDKLKDPKYKLEWDDKLKMYVFYQTDIKPEKYYEDEYGYKWRGYDLPEPKPAPRPTPEPVEKVTKQRDTSALNPFREQNVSQPKQQQPTVLKTTMPLDKSSSNPMRGYIQTETAKKGGFIQ